VHCAVLAGVEAEVEVGWLQANQMPESRVPSAKFVGP
jgi:hypothetical protein